MLHWAEHPEITSLQLNQARMATIESYQQTALTSVALKNEYFSLKNYLKTPDKTGHLSSSSTSTVNRWTANLNKLTGVEPELSRHILNHFFNNILSQIDLPLHQQKPIFLGRLALYNNNSIGSATDPSLPYDRLGEVMYQTDYLIHMPPAFYMAAIEIKKEKLFKGF